MTWYLIIYLWVILILLAVLIIMFWATGVSKIIPQAFDALKGITIFGGVMLLVIFLYKLNWFANKNITSSSELKKESPIPNFQEGENQRKQQQSKKTSPTLPPEREKEIVVRANEHFVDTGIVLKKGQKVIIRASGEVTGGKEYSLSRKTGPDGWGRGCLPEDWLCGAKLLVHDSQASFMALCYKIGSSPWKQAGSFCQFVADEEGTLYFSTNDIMIDSRGDKYPDCWRMDNWGSFKVNVVVEESIDLDTTVE